MQDKVVDYYTVGHLNMTIPFPNGFADCRHCRFCWFSDAFNVYRCRLTDAYIDKKELSLRELHCPIEIETAAF